MRHPLASAFTVTCALSFAVPARASQPVAADDASIGTTPARAAAPEAPTADVAPEPSVGAVRAREAPIAVDPPGDWAVLHAGLRPHLGTFGGIGTFALAHARTERFYGVLSLSAIRNDAGTHVGLAQIALGRNLADDFVGGAQVSLTENRARDFVGLAQTALAYNRAGEAVTVVQLAAYDRARVFDGVLQLGGYAQATTSFTGLAQIAFVSTLGEAPFRGTQRDDRFAGLAQVGFLSTIDGNFRGVAQIGAASFVAEDFTGVAQIGGLAAGAKRFYGLAQIGAGAVSEKSVGLQIGGAAIALDDHTGVQIGAGTYAGAIDGAQLGVANVATRVRGVQIGMFNHATSLRGVQIGLVNHAEDGVLPWTALLNMGFGDGDGGEVRDDDRAVAADRARAAW